MEAANANSRLALKRGTHVAHGFTAAQMATMFAGSPIGYDDMGRTNGLFLSSFDVTKSRGDLRCGSATNAMADQKSKNLGDDCFASDGRSSNTNTSASGFPMYDSFTGSETAQHSGGVGSGPYGLGAGGSGGGGNGPIGPGPVNPTVPISTPEPGTLMLLASGLLVLGGLAKRRAVHGSVNSN